MYCPICGVEYRPGFTTCSDCQVALVPDPPSTTSQAAPPMDAGFVLLWSGTDPHKHAEVIEALERENIPERTVRREDRLVYAYMQPPFEVYVPAALHPRAKATLEETMLMEEAEKQAAESGILEIPAEDDYSGNEDDSRREAADWHEEGATSKIWSGQDSEVAGMITASLRENQISYRTNADEANLTEEPEETGREEISTEETGPEGKTIEVFVPSEDEARGKEIVREIVNAAPPESGTK
jgi:hypothetical protein